MSDDNKTTKVYARCEACCKISRPEAGAELPVGWIALGRSTEFNAPRAVCSTECQRKVSAA